MEISKTRKEYLVALGVFSAFLVLNELWQLMNSDSCCYDCCASTPGGWCMVSLLLRPLLGLVLIYIVVRVLLDP